MNIAICGSIFFIDEMTKAKKILEEKGHDVQMPPTEVQSEDGGMMLAKDLYTLRKVTTEIDGWIWERKAWAMKLHFDKVEWSDAILVLNYDKNGISGYVGANTLLEMGLAMHFGKKIFLLHPIPQQSYTEEIRGMNPFILNGDINAI